MVARPNDNCFIADGRFTCCWRRFSYCSFYLYTFLMMGSGKIKKDTSKTTMLVISMGFLALFLLFTWKWAVFVSLGIGLIGIASDYLSIKIESNTTIMGANQNFLRSFINNQRSFKKSILLYCYTNLI